MNHQDSLEIAFKRLKQLDEIIAELTEIREALKDSLTNLQDMEERT